MDALGHVNQAVYHELLEEARAVLFTKILGAAATQDLSQSYVLAHVDLDHHAEVRKDHDEVEIVARVAGVGTSSIRVEHEILLPDGTLAASGQSVLVGWDAQTRGKRKLSEAELAALTA
jgi:acyl-CoA thioester hydrolase